MATKEAIAKVREIAIKDLKESVGGIAEKLGIDVPDFSFYFRDKDYQQAEELKTLAAFNQSVLAALEGTNNVDTTETEAKQSKR